VAMGWPSGKILWQTPNDKGLDVQALPDGHILFTRDAKSMVVEIDGRRNMVWSAGPEQGLKKPYSVQRLANGNTLVGDADGARLPYQALRLPNGNTLIGLVDPGEVVEVDPLGTIVRSVGGKNGAVRLSWIAGMAVLPNGGLMLADFTSRRLVEVDAAGNLVHE